MDLEYIREHVPLPSSKQYPNATRMLFKPHRLEQAVVGAIQTRLKRTIPPHLKPSVQYKSSQDLPTEVAQHMAVGSWACAVKVDVPDVLECDAIALGSSKKTAKQAAWALIVARLHSQDDLRHLFPAEAARLGDSVVNSKTVTKESPRDEAPKNEAQVLGATSKTKIPIDVRYTSQYIAQHMPLPVRKDYPILSEVFGLFSPLKPDDPTDASNGCKFLCQTERYSIDYELGERYEGETRLMTCVLRLAISHREKYVSFGVTGYDSHGKAGKRAKTAAWLSMFSQLHTSGFCRRLEDRLAIELYATKDLGALATADRILPTRKQYPEAPKSLFRPDGIVSTIHEVCQKIDMHLEMQYHNTPVKGDLMHGKGLTRVTLQVELPHFSAETNVSAISTKIAKRGAWVEMLSKLHTSGALRPLFPVEDQEAPLSDTDHSAVVSKAPSVRHDKHSTTTTDTISDEEDMEMIEVKKETLTKEKDAKVDIYNFAASIGATPLFEFQAMRLGRQNRKKHKGTNAVRVSIDLSELRIQASALGRDLRSAETAACIKFKQKAEQSEAAQEATKRQPGPHRGLLTSETATQFFDLYRRSGKGVSIAVEHEDIHVAGATRNQARIMVGDRPFGRPVVMATKKAAENLAYLVAAVELVKEQPDMLSEFAHAMREGKGKILRDVRPVTATLDYMTLSDIRESLVEARRIGLPDERSSLHAEDDRRSSRANRRPVPNDSEHEVISQSLLKAHEHYESDPDVEAIRQTKADLPMSQHSAQVLDLLSGGVYSIIIGATGSGKTTQVPQIILENAIRKQRGGLCNIVCTQPRRLAASSVARRVSAELGEHLGSKVGYHVRGEARLPSPGGSITYCTTGILLQQLKFDADAVMDSTSHLIIDEVHERDMFIDFLLIILKKAVKARLAAGKTVPQVVLMSATLDPELFTRYLAEDDIECPVLSVPGRTFPVEETYLDEILHNLSRHDARELEQLISLDKAVSSDYVASERSFSASVNGSTDGSRGIDWKGRHVQALSDEGSTVVREQEEALVPLPLVAATIAHITKTTSDGAILVFLPGLQEITGVQDILTSHRPFGVDFSDTEKFKICLLHSAVPAAEQREVLDPPQSGCRKIILSTNIAETSVTVPDVKYVVDTGKLREKRYDQLTRITKLQCTWASNSNVRQRAGRAGRVQEGFYYALYSKERRQKMTPSGLPEILRSDLQETCLSIKAQGFEEPVATFLSQAIEPPSDKAVNIAVENLRAIEAFTSEQELTALGRVLATLPVHPSLGKMVLLGIVFRCLDPMLVLGAMGSERPLFINPVSGRDVAKAAQKQFATEESDHLAFYKAFADLRSVRARIGEYSASYHAVKNSIHMGAFKNITQVAQQIEQILVEHGLIPDARTERDSSMRYGDARLNENSTNWALVKALLVAGSHPNLGIKKPGNKSTLFRTPAENNVRIHPSSHNYKKAWPAEEDFLYMYTTLAKSASGDALFMRDTSRVTPFMVLLFGGRLETDDWRKLVMDDWLRFDIHASRKDYAIRLILEYRKALDRMLNGAFKSLSELGNGKSMADDAVVEHFARGVARLLASAPEGQPRQAQQQIPSHWKKRQSQPLAHGP
ncbi:ATP-dependent DNA/RNA helicase DHX36 [Fulvia fulva]|uniref:RNA helicase n=1 Tax=Passalora fulva TaxID=5499 RepID=A0A9Q8URD1_PASFU|nr:ATP-dependent DNA/RNA helicase DHX36 [Fulvia fulva]KAK4620855.1 ATP-dependent DNA/RNA helicase DHX36 [Fulvia fulva]UJO19628.1 ATP-dependent DNA/RNA helicase DHX36 [Fulvia fulva]